MIIDPQSPLYLKAVTIAIGQFLSGTPEGMAPLDVLDALAESPEQWPEDILAWQPFEFDLPETVAEYIEQLAESIYRAFIVDAYASRCPAELAA